MWYLLNPSYAISDYCCLIYSLSGWFIPWGNWNIKVLYYYCIIINFSLLSVKISFICFGASLLHVYMHMSGLPWGAVKESTCNSGDMGDSSSIPRLGRFPGRGNSNPLQYYFLKKIPWTQEPGGLQFMGRNESGPTEQLNTSKQACIGVISPTDSFIVI